MNKLKAIYLTLFMATICSNTLFGQFIEKYSFEFDLEPYNNINNIESHESLDFLNAVMEYDSSFFDEMNINTSAHIWHKNNWESHIEIGIQSDLRPRHFDLLATKRINNWSLNMGVGNQLFFLYEIEKYWETKGKNFYTKHNNQQFYYSLLGPYIGANYHIQTERIALSATINSGVQWNTTKNKNATLIESQSNYIKHITYDINNTPSIWISPAIKAYLSFIKTSKFEMGPYIRYRYYYTPRRLKYEKTVYELTYDNPQVSTPEFAIHHIQRHSIYLGIFILIK